MSAFIELRDQDKRPDHERLRVVQSSIGGDDYGPRWETRRSLAGEEGKGTISSIEGV